MIIKIKKIYDWHTFKEELLGVAFGNDAHNDQTRILSLFDKFL